MVFADIFFMSTSASKSDPAKRTKSSLTPAEREKQIILAKVRRLNLKLSKTKQIAVHMNMISSKNNQVSSGQVAEWSKKLLEILNG